MKSIPASHSKAYRMLAIAAAVCSLAGAATAAAADVFAQPVLVEVSVNGQAPVDGLLALIDGGNHIYVRVSDAVAWRLKFDETAGFQHEGDRFVPLDDIPGVTYRFSSAEQSLSIVATADAFATNRVDFGTSPTAPMTRPSLGGFLNYDLFAQSGAGSREEGGFVEAGLFAGGGYGTSSFVGRRSRESSGLVRLETSWTIDDPQRLRSIKIGDAIARASAVTPPFRFAGLQWGTDFTVRPGYLTLPVPTVHGSAALPSTIDLYVNNILAATQPVAPGPFEISNPPILVGNGDVQLVVRDALGRQTVTTMQYYASTQLLRRGLHDFSYGIGFLRKDFGTLSMAYGEAVLSGTHRYGVNSSLTIEAHGEATESVQLASASTAILVGHKALLTLSAGSSQSSRGIGRIVSFGLERRSQNLSFAAGADFATRGFTTVGSAHYQRPTRTIRGIVSLPLGRGRLSANYLLREGPGLHEELAGLSSSFSLGPVLFSASAFRSMGSRKGTGGNVFLSVPFGRRSVASLSNAYDRGRDNTTLAIQQNVPAGQGFGYYASATKGDVDQAEGRLFYQGSVQSYEADVTRVEGQTAFRGRVSGSIGLVDDQLFAARQLADSFAVVHAGQVEGVRVYADNQLVARTNRSGVAVVPYLRAYDANVIRIEQGDLPVDVSVGPTEQIVRPYRRNGVRIDYAVASPRSATVTVRRVDGSPVPAGAVARIEGSPEGFLVAPDGAIYLAGLGDWSRVNIGWDGEMCSFVLFDPPGGPAQPNLGVQTCTDKEYNAQ